MTGTEIKQKAQKYAGKQLTDSTALDIINEALDWLGRMGYVEGRITIDADAKRYYELPPDLIFVKNIVDDEDYYYYNYLIDDNMIRFKDAGIYEVNARRLPSLASIEDNLDVHQMLQACVLDYVKGSAKLRKSSDDEDGLRLLQKFERDSVKTYKTLSRNRRKPSKVTVIRHA